MLGRHPGSWSYLAFTIRRQGDREAGADQPPLPRSDAVRFGRSEIKPGRSLGCVPGQRQIVIAQSTNGQALRGVQSRTLNRVH
jgi:hypothetical protein